MLFKLLKLCEITGVAGKHAPVVIDDELLPQDKYSMMTYAKDNFRQGLERYEMKRGVNGSIRGTLVIRDKTDGLDSISKKDRKKKKQVLSGDSQLEWSWSELAQLVKYTKSPIQASLTKLSNTHLNKLALDGFIAVMKFMGDYNAKGKTDTDIVIFLVLMAQKHEELRDEVYCHLLKQTTSNRSTWPESCARGWRLLVILSSYIKPSNTFERYLRSYLQNTGMNKDREFQDQAIFCLRNLKQTIKHGGRKVVPDVGELSAIICGKYTKIQKLFLPGERTKSIKINAVTVVNDVISNLCSKMGVDNFAEYALFIFTQNAAHGTLLRPQEYILDSTTILEKRTLPYRLCFKKYVWFAPTPLDNVTYVSMIFDQVLPEFIKGTLLVLEEMTPQYLQDEYSLLLCLIHVAYGTEPTLQDLLVHFREYISVDLNGRVSATQWSAAITRSWDKLSSGMTATEAQQQFLSILGKFTLFGSRFFYLESVSDLRIR